MPFISRSYAFTQLDYPGSSGVSFQVVTGINNAGTLVGYIGGNGSTGQMLSVSYLYQPDVSFSNPFSPFTSPAGTQVQVRALSNSSTTATAVGTSLSASGSVTGTISIKAATGSTPAPGPTPPSGGFNAHLLGINDAGAEVGYYVVNTVSNGVTVASDIAASVSGGALVALSPTLAASVGAVTGSRATGIDDFGNIVGTMTVAGAGGGSTVEGFIDAKGASSIAPFFVTGSTRTEILATNNQFQIAGDFTDSTGAVHGFVYDYSTNTFNQVDAPGATATVVDSINDQGDLVGYYTDANGITHGFLDALLATGGGPQIVTNPLAGSTVALVQGSNAVQVGGFNSVTLLDPGYGHATLSANSGSDTIRVLGASDTIVATSPASDLIDDSKGASAVIYLGSGKNTLMSGMASTVISASGGADSITGYGSVIFAAGLAAGADTVGATSLAGLANTIIGGAGTLDVTSLDTVAGTLLFGGSGTNVVEGPTVTSVAGSVATAAAATLVGGTGTNYLTEGSGGGLVVGGTGGKSYLTGNDVAVGPTASMPGVPSSPGNLAQTTILALSGASTITAYAGAVFLTGSTDQLVISGIAASVGNLSLVGSGSNGNDQYVLGTNGAKDQVFEGSGNDTIFFGGGGNAQIVEGSGRETFYLGSNVVSGSDTIYGFTAGKDQVLLATFDQTAVDKAVRQAAPAPGGSSVVTLNGVRIEFYGVGSLSSSSFQHG